MPRSPQKLLETHILLRTARLILLLILALPAAPAFGQATTPSSGDGIDLAGDWKSQLGDDPSWADPSYDDSGWRTVSVPSTWAEQGYLGQEGYIWYRRQIRLQPGFEAIGARAESFGVVLGPVRFASYQIYAGGRLLGGHGGDSLKMPVPKARVFAIPAASIDPTGQITVALRLWRVGWSSDREGEEYGPFTDPFALGDFQALSDRVELDWRRTLETDLTSLVLAILFAFVGLYHLHFFFHRRSQTEYLWFGLTALAFAANTLILSQWIFQLTERSSLVLRLTEISGHVAIAAGIQFLWPFLSNPIGKWLRGYQISHWVLAALILVWPDPGLIQDSRSPRWLWLVPLLVAAVWLIIRKWRQGNREARTVAAGVLVLVVLEIHELSIATLGVQFWSEVPLSALGFAAGVFSMAFSLSAYSRRIYRELEQGREEIVETASELSLVHLEQEELIELMARGASLTDLLETLARSIERQSPDLLCSILLLASDGKTLTQGAAPSLPEGYNRAIDGVAIGPKEGSCGTAVYRQETVIVSDIATDPLWEDYRELALDHGLRACWSTPIWSSNHNILGAFALYYREPRHPDPGKLEVIRRSSHLAGVAIERKRAQEALASSEEKYRDLVENASELICTHDFEGRLLSVNRSLVKARGYDKREEIVGQRIDDFLHPKVRATFPDYLQVLRKVGRAGGLMRIVTLGGEEKILEYQNTLRQNAANGPLVRGVFRDVTLRVDTERVLNQLRHQNEMILDAVGEGIYGLDLNGNTTFVNPAAARMIGWKPEDLIGKNQHEILHHSRPDGSPYPPEECPIFAAFKDGAVRRVDTEVFWRKDGSHFPVAYTSTPIRDKNEGLAGAVVTFRDITERKRTEVRTRQINQELEQRVRERTAELQTSENRLHQVIDLVPHMIFARDYDGRFLLVNKAFAASYGLTVKEVTGRLLEEIHPVASEPEQFLREDRQVIDSRETLLIEEKFVYKSDGQEHIHQVIKIPFTIADQENSAMLAIAVDVTDLKSLEAQFLQAQRLEAVGKLASGVAHDFNNLLSVILGYASLALVELKSYDPLFEKIVEIEKAGQRAASLTRQLLAFSRQQVLEPIVLQLNRVVSDMEKMFRRIVGEDIDLVIGLEPNLEPIRADHGQLE